MEFSIGKLLSQAGQLGQQSFAKAADWLSSGFGFVQESFGRITLLGSNESVAGSESQLFDEKHYFVVPYCEGDAKHRLYVMRCLPEEAPPINDLPKRRVLHLPHESALPMLETLLTEEARDAALRVATGSATDVSAPTPPATARSSQGLGGRLNDLADQIDQLDGQVFNGVLAIGGLVALLNPVAGATIAAKALAPSAAMLVSKFGLRTVGEKLEQRRIAAEVRSAEQKVLRQFRDTPAVQVVNPVLAALKRALETKESEFDPLLELDFETTDFGTQDRQRMLKLTFRAVSNTYEQALATPARWGEWNLGKEDVRWLQMIRDLDRGA